MGLMTDVAKDLLAIKAVQIKTDHYFTWTSGIKSPIYCDNRLTMSYPEVRQKIMKAFIEKIEQMDKKPEVIAGCATAGIPHAAWLADALNLPMVYVRSKPKEHGKGNQIEGEIPVGKRVLVIEDLISTGGSVLNVARALQNAGAEIIGVLAIFTYGLKKAEQQFAEAKIPYDTITNYDALLNILEANGQISESERQELEAWRNNLS